MKTLISRLLAVSLSVFIASVLFVTQATQIYAGTDLTVSCTGSGCTTTPPGTPLFNESNWIPGDSATQVVTATNASAQNGTFAVEADEQGVPTALKDVLFIEIHEGSLVGPVVYASNTLTNFLSGGFTLLSSVSASSTKDYFFTLTFDHSAGNEYQGLTEEFDLTVGFELVPLPSPSPSGGGGGGGPSVLGATQCTTDAPSSSPSNLNISASSDNTVTLQWNPVSPVTHYALIFTRISDGAQYGSTNIGNVTSYTINGLSGGGASYTFEIFGVNDCQPGPRSSVTGAVGGAVLETGPTGPEGEVLGVVEDLEFPTPGPSPETGIFGDTLGATDGVCTEPWWRWIMAIVYGMFLILAIILGRARAARWWGVSLVSGAITMVLVWLYICDKTPWFVGAVIAYLVAWFLYIALPKKE